MEKRFKRVLIKISGEALAGDKGNGYDSQVLAKVAEQIAEIAKSGVQTAIVVGGGNFWRGREKLNIARTTSDYMGMLATVMNAMCLAEAIGQAGVKAEVQSALGIEHVAEAFNRRKTVSLLESGTVVVFGGGTGCPFFSTDTTAALRAAEIDADILLLAKNVDGIYDSDPKLNDNAKKFDKISYLDFIKLNLKAMDSNAVVLCKDNNIPVYAFALGEEGAIQTALKGDFSRGTIIE